MTFLEDEGLALRWHSFIIIFSGGPINADVNAGVILTPTCREDFFSPVKKLLL